MAGPRRITVRSYQVGFGDCFLLGFHYARSRRHVLIDFGSTALPKNRLKNHMVRVAESIRKECGGKLHAVVATHRHKDHVSGFSTRSDGTGSGDIIRSLKPDVVIQPWTEDPNAKPDARRATRVSQAGRAMVAMLDDLHSVASAVQQQAKGLSPRSGLRRQLEFLGETNLANRSAVENLMSMGKTRRYVNFGAGSGLRLPGVRVRVLGPPTLEQSETIRKQRHKDESEFWHLMALAEDFGLKQTGLPFSKYVYRSKARPKRVRWMIHRIKQLRPRQLREIVRALDKALNNTSVILLFEVGKHKLLFPGDAQLENWTFALSKPAIKKLLEDTTLYKVGHHGSLNATPKSLWFSFGKRSEKTGGPDRLVTMVSTMKGKHGSTRRDTEVPRRTLVKELEKFSDFHTTEALSKPTQALFLEETIDLP